MKDRKIRIVATAEDFFNVIRSAQNGLEDDYSVECGNAIKRVLNKYLKQVKINPARKGEKDIMNRTEQIEFVNSICGIIQRKIIANIESGKIPENWERLELRHYITHLAETHSFLPLEGKRKKEYDNTILVSDL